MRSALPLAAVLVVTWPALARANADEALSRARNAYVYGDYKDVVDQLRGALYPAPQLTSREQVIEARRLLGLAYLFLGGPDAEHNAEREFVALLTLSPDYRLDPLTDPPAYIEIYDHIRDRIQPQLAEIRRREQEAADARRHADEARARELDDLRRRLADTQRYVYVADRVDRSRLIATLPLGVGQFQNGDRKKGLFFMVSELATGLTSMALFATLRLQHPHGLPADASQDERNTADVLASTMLISGAAFYGLALAGIVDAHYNYRLGTPGAPRPVLRESLQGQER